MQVLATHSVEERYLHVNETVAVVGVLQRDKGGLKLVPGQQGHISSHPGLAPACADTSARTIPEFEVQGLEMPPRLETKAMHLDEKARQLRAPRKSVAGR